MNLPNGTRIEPDFIVSRNASSYIIDITLVVDNANLDSEHCSKVKKYDASCVSDL